uniref:Serpentine receptor class r-10 n=1 Tax=Caenorhabditis japonica TaxID=281687 RepID=A0A8R1DZX2_CAEJA
MIILPEFWQVFLKTTQQASAIVSVVLNTLLTFLILFRSPKNLGSYKYLMIYITLFGISYSITDAVTEPNIFSFEICFIVFRNFKRSIFTREESLWLLCVLNGFFCALLAIFGVHFIYRYGALNTNFRRKYLTGAKQVCLFLLPLFYGSSWCVLCGYCFHYDTQSDNFVRYRLLEVYDVRVEEIAYTIVNFYEKSKENGDQLVANTTVFSAVACIWFMILSSFICSIYFGTKCYFQLAKSLSTTDWNSKATKSIQKQLFRSLVIQTFIPVILIYLPVVTLFALPMFNVDLGFAGSFVPVTIALYPAIEPLPTMFIVKSFRDAIFCGQKTQFETTISG